ncbi:MAG: superoxide dismutase [Mariniphaga sp.]|nr:superoxide dismutase [Mariniphaga sp.]
MKKRLVSILVVVLFATFSFAGKPFPADNAFWNKAFAKLADSQLTGQSKQLPLPYAYNALEPSVDAKTMEIHYSKHHAAYTKNMNDATTGPEFASKTLFQLFTEIEKYPVLVKNNGGGFYNHLLFWMLMAPASGQEPTGELLKAINESFGSVDKFKETFSNAGKKQFGSGWAWLSVNENGKLVVSSTPNQDNPLMSTTEVRGIPVLTLDVWEHAYYLQYQNRRPEYVDAFWKIVNWKEVSRRYDEALKALK